MITSIVMFLCTVLIVLTSAPVVTEEVIRNPYYGKWVVFLGKVALVVFVTPIWLVVTIVTHATYLGLLVNVMEALVNML